MDHAEPPPGPGALRVWVFYAPEQGSPDLRAVSLPAGATVEQAIGASGLRAAHPELATLDVRYGIDGRRVLSHSALRDGDRIDLCRPLHLDPMTARRLRAAAAGRPKKSEPQPRG